jgi:type II secretory pathway component PulJ
MCPKSSLLQLTPEKPIYANGFILLEVLVAMSLVASSWVALGATYQQLALRLAIVQEQRVQVKKALDEHEINTLGDRQSQPRTPPAETTQKKSK